MRIALVEPSRTVRRIVTGMIAAGDHEVCGFMDAPEALAYVEAEKDVRALITSAELTSTSGIQLVGHACTLAGTRRPLYIILMSSSDERTKMIQALDKGADDFISKPPAPEELRARLRAADRITSMQAELIVLATTDSLTGLLTRRAFVEAAHSMLTSTSAASPLSVLICDLDKFKTINDGHGHTVGDTVLQMVSQVATSFDVPVGRLGGEEFAFLIHGHSAEAASLAEHFRDSVSQLAIPAGTGTIGITCSVGAAEWQSGDTVDSLLRRADIALYEAKRLGRNRVVVADTFLLSEDHERWRGIARLAKRSAYMEQLQA